MNVHDDLIKLLKHVSSLDDFIGALLLSDNGIVSSYSSDGFSWSKSIVGNIHQLNKGVQALLSGLQLGKPVLFASECHNGKIGLLYSKEGCMYLAVAGGPEVNTGMLFLSLEEVMDMVNHILDSYSHFSS